MPLFLMYLQWAPEIRHFLPSCPIILVGTKCDLRSNKEEQDRLRRDNQQLVTTEQGEALAKEIGAVGYMECSALTRQGLTEVLTSLFF